MCWVVSVSECCNDVARTYHSPPHGNAADARVLAAMILGRPQVTGEGPWQEAIAGGRRTVSVKRTHDGRVF
jgi:hypothetical protein